MNPSIGRIVHYFDVGVPDPVPYAAIVISAFEQEVDLVVFHPAGKTKYVYGVPFADNLVDEDEYYWAWPPRV